MAEPPAMRASDADRERAATVLREAAGDGRLTVEELTERLEQAWSAATLDALGELTADLTRERPGATGAPAAGAPPAGARRTGWLVAVMGGTSRRGRWRAAPRLRAIALMGGVDVDLRDAELAAGEVRIVAVPIMGGVTVTVPEGVEADVGGFVLMGGKDDRVRGTPRPGAPRVVVRAWGAMGGVTVRSRPRRSDADADAA